MEKQIYRVEGMSCASCAGSVETLLKSVNGVENAVVNLAANTVLVEFNELKTNELQLKNALEPAGYLLFEDINTSIENEEKRRFEQLNILKFNLIGSALFSIPVFILSMFFHHYHNLYWLQLVLSLPVVLWFGRQFYIIGIKRLVHGAASMDSLIAIGTGAAFIFSLVNTAFSILLVNRGIEPQVYFESAVVIITFILLGRFLEEKAKHATGMSIRKLIGLQARTALRVEPDGDKEILIENISLGDQLRVRPGESIPTDGIVKSGLTYIDESMITGESLAVEKKAGEIVTGGTMNQSGSIVIEAIRIGSETTLAKIVKHVKEAQGSKAPIQKQADRIAAIFVPIVIGIAIISFVAWYFFSINNGLYQAFSAFFAVLVIACPCALGLATPTALVVGIGKAAENGILIKDASSLESSCQITDLVIDKTGTLTTGIQTVTTCFPDVEKVNNNLLAVILNAEKKSEHPTAKAIIKYFESKEINGACELDSFRNIPGQGIEAISNSISYLIGNELLIKNNAIAIPFEISNEAQLILSQNATIVYVANSEEVLMVMGITDTLKPTTSHAIQNLLSSGIQLHLLSGDNDKVVSKVAHELGITYFRSNASPVDKMQYIKELQKENKKVAMAGDGINDAPALAQAHVSFAMSNGTDVAAETAQMVLINGDLSKISKAILFSKQTVKTIKMNLFWAFFYNVITIPLAAGLLYPLLHVQLSPMIAGAAMAFSSVSVVLNSVLLKKRINQVAK